MRVEVEMNRRLEPARSLRAIAGRSAMAAAALAALLVGCQTRPVPATPAPAPGSFWPEQAALDFEWLDAIGDRSSGSRGARETRDRLRDLLLEGGIASEEWRFAVPGDVGGYPDLGERELVTLVGKIPGPSPDVFLLAAHYDTPRAPGTAGAGEDASGAALVLGLGRALVARELPYTVWLVFVDGDSAADGVTTSAISQPFAGSAALVERLAERGELERIRLAVFFRRVAGQRLEVPRDLHSHRVYREVFFEVADDLGYGDVFGAGGQYVSGATGHRAFLAGDLRQVVAITGRSPIAPESADEALGESASEPDPGRALGIVGTVTLEALDRIAARLVRIDRFGEDPLEGRDAPAIQDEPPASARD